MTQFYSEVIELLRLCLWENRGENVEAFKNMMCFIWNVKCQEVTFWYLLCVWGKKKNLVGKAIVLHWILASARPSEPVAYKASNFG